jgi:hypothetical protein
MCWVAVVQCFTSSLVSLAHVASLPVHMTYVGIDGYVLGSCCAMLHFLSRLIGPCGITSCTHDLCWYVCIHTGKGVAIFCEEFAVAQHHETVSNSLPPCKVILMVSYVLLIIYCINTILMLYKVKLSM